MLDDLESKAERARFTHWPDSVEEFWSIEKPWLSPAAVEFIVAMTPMVGLGLISARRTAMQRRDPEAIE